MADALTPQQVDALRQRIAALEAENATLRAALTPRNHSDVIHWLPADVDESTPGVVLGGEPAEPIVVATLVEP